MDEFFGIGSIGRGFFEAERTAKNIEASAVGAARAYAGLVSGFGSSFGIISDILQSAAAVNLVGSVFANGHAGDGENFSANRKGIDRDNSAKKFPFALDISGGIAVTLQYIEALESVRSAAVGTIGTLSALAVGVNVLRNNTIETREITLSFGGILGGTVAVALAALGNSVIWLRKLCSDSMTEIGNSAMVLAAFFGGIWNEPLSMAVTQFMWFGSSALSVIGSVVSAVGAVFSGMLPRASEGASQKNGSGIINTLGGWGNSGGLSEVFVGGNSPIVKSDLFNRISPFTSNKSNAFYGDYIRYDQAFAAGYLIGDILTRSVGLGGNSYTNISSTNSEKIASEVSKITENTSKSVSASEISTEDLKFLRDIAARDVINRFTTAQVSVSMGGVTNNLSGITDLDGIIDYLANGVKTAMESAAEGVHS